MLERLPVGGCMSVCAYEPVEEDDEFRAALAAGRSTLVYASVDYWNDDDAAQMLAGLGRILMTIGSAQNAPGISRASDFCASEPLQRPRAGAAPWSGSRSTGSGTRCGSRRRG